MNKKTTKQRIEELEDKDINTAWGMAGLLFTTIIIFISLAIAMPSESDIQEQIDKSLNQTLSNLVRWECSSTKIHIPNCGVAFAMNEFPKQGCVFDKPEGLTVESKEFLEQQYCTRERPILNPNLEREVWYEI